MTYLVDVQLPLRIRSEANLRGHWGAFHRRAAEQRGIARLAVQAKLPPRECPPSRPVTVLLRRIAPRELDDDNLRRALKAVRDGVADALRVDDREPLWVYEQARGRVKEYAVRIAVSLHSNESPGA